MSNRETYGAPGPPLQAPVPRRPQPNPQQRRSVQGQGFVFPPPGQNPGYSQPQSSQLGYNLGTFRCAFCNKEQLQTQFVRLQCFHKICNSCMQTPADNQIRSCPICTSTPRKILGGSSSEFMEHHHTGGSENISNLGLSTGFSQAANLSVDTFSIWGPYDIERSLHSPSLTQQARQPYLGQHSPGPSRLPFTSSGTQLASYGTTSFSPSPLAYLYGSQQQQQRQPPVRFQENLSDQLSTETSWLSLNPVELGRPQPGTQQICASCGDDEVQAQAFCEECRENLCGDCVAAHFRVRVTREHHIHPLNRPVDMPGSIFGSGSRVQTFAVEPSEITTQSYSQSTSKSDSESPKSSSGGSLGRNSCAQHDAPFVSTCTTCGGVNLCVKCLYDHSKHQIKPFAGDPVQALKGLLIESKAVQNNIDDSLEGVRRMIERVDVSVQSVTSELRSVIHLHISALEERKRDLLQRVETIRNTKMSNLKTQNDKLNERRKAITEAVSKADMVVNLSPKNGNGNGNGGEEFLRKVQETYDLLLNVHSTSPVNLQPNDTDVIRFILNDQTLISKIRILGDVISGVCAKTSHLLGFSYKKAILGRKCNVHVQLKDACGEIVPMQGPIPLQAHIFGPLPNRRQLETNLTEKENGIVTISYTPLKEGTYVLDVTLGGISIGGCPVEISVRSGRDYKEAMMKGPRFSFGKEGSDDGEFSRPWGICCDHKGRIIVADRSNNRIQFFNKDGNFMSKFGSSGTGPGEFDRPAGVTNHIIVADKDNHRIQVFTEEGFFLLRFGERGRAAGSFYYPWGVACNSNNDIAVSDTRNHRIQIFNEKGQFLRKCGFDNSFLYKHLDSPRGVCYLPDGDLLVTDFNNHRLAVINSAKNPPELRCIGSEGEQPGLFHRPQGVVLDPEGHILVCDSRNNRIQVLNIDDMTVVAILGNPHPPEPSSERSGTSSTSVFSGFSMPPPQTINTGADSPIPPVPIPPQTYPILSHQESPPKKGSKQQSLAPRQIQAPILDRPADVCVSVEGLVYVVDFGHNCVRVY